MDNVIVIISPTDPPPPQRDNITGYWTHRDDVPVARPGGVVEGGVAAGVSLPRAAPARPANTMTTDNVTIMYK